LAITDHPTAAWTAQQIIDAFPDGTAPRWLVRDRDVIVSCDRDLLDLNPFWGIGIVAPADYIDRLTTSET
jgi:hypothetical protein